MSTNDQGREDATVQIPAGEEPTEALPAGEEPAEAPAGVAPTETLSAVPDDASAPQDPAPGPVPDWRGAQSPEEARAAGGTGPTGMTADATAEPAAAPAPEPAPGPAAPGVWTAATTAPGPGEPLPEAPFRGVRVGQLIWAGIVMVVGVFLIGLALMRNIDVPFLLIGLIALLGLGLVVAAVLTASRRR